jgi:mono/diheme cytochrome c family protein
MPAFEGKLADKDIVDVLAFIKSRWPALILDKRREAGMN